MTKLKILLLSALFLLIILAIFLIFPFLRGKLSQEPLYFSDIGSYNIPPDAIEVNVNNSYGQSFMPNFDNLFMVSIFIKKQELDNSKELFFHLKKNKSDKDDLVRIGWRYDQIRYNENSFYLAHPQPDPKKEGFHFYFQFPPISDSKGKEFYFYFDSPQAEAGGGIKIGAWDKRQDYPALVGGSRYLNHAPEKGFIAFMTYHTWRGGPKDLFRQIAARISKDAVFMNFYACLLLINFIGILAIGRFKNNG
ncbi:MAG: hypothetical protein Q8L26_02485 [Candidatus Omnitrophota bacterium]|nr:hypothetical protein [Candidatus Omnitrophota bacterium]